MQENLEMSILERKIAKMETTSFEDLLKEEMKNPKFKSAFEKEYQRISNMKEYDKKVTSYDFRLDKIKNEKKSL